MPEEQITYKEVEAGVNELLKCADIMEDIFNNVSGQVNNMTNPDNFRGVASDAFSGEFADLKKNFPDYVQKVRDFAEAYRIAGEALKTTEEEQRRKAQQL